MAQVGEGDAAMSQLASIKAVTPGYPLRGHLSLKGQGDQDEVITHDIPAAGTVWIDPVLLLKLHIHIGDTIKLGDKDFKVTQVIAKEPDKGGFFANFAPRVMLQLPDLAATHLIQYGSRVNYRLLAAGDPSTATAFEKWAQSEIKQANVRGAEVETLESSQQDMRATLDRAEQFLSLVGLLSAMLAAVAVAMAARRFMLRHVDACAMLRCLGMTQNQVTVLYLAEFFLVGLLGSTIGIALGYVGHYVLLEWLGKLVASDLPAASWLPGAQALATGMVLLIGFAVPPILQLRGISHNRVIRREQDPPQAMTITGYVLGLCSFMGLLLWQSHDLKLGLMTAGGFLGGLLLFALIAWLALRSLRNARNLSNSPAWRFAVTALRRRAGATVVQIVSLALGLMALLLLTVIRGDLVHAWRQSTPPDAPNHFIVNIQPDEKEKVEQQLIADGITHPRLYPMMRGRLVSINDKTVNGDAYEDKRARGLVEREFNLSTMHDLPDTNKIIEGKWYDDTQPEASVEEGIAKTLHMHMGDKLTFDVAGQTVSAKITSMRKLDWGSMRVNFFVILNPKAVVDLPQTWVTAFRAPQGNVAIGNELTRDFPNLTVIDVGSILKQIQDMIDQVIAAVEFLFLFALAAGVLVLYAALASSQDERTREAGILRALGATRAQLSKAQWIEFTLIGGLAGLLAASGAAAVGWSLAHYVFKFDWVFDPLVWAAGIAVGAACAMIGGWVGLRNVLNQPPLATLRGI